MKIFRNFPLFLLAFIAISCSSAQTETDPEENASAVVEVVAVEPSLYDRLGGANGISSLVDDIVDAHINNPIVHDNFAYLESNPEHMELFKRHVREFLGAGTGGNEQYSGQDMPTVHAHMKITDTQFLAVVDDILAVLTNHNIDEQT